VIGWEKKARVEAAEVLRTHPKFSVDSWKRNLPHRDQSQNEKSVNALRRLGRLPAMVTTSENYPGIA
jgi:hypothetical protein